MAITTGYDRHLMAIALTKPYSFHYSYSNELVAMRLSYDRHKPLGSPISILSMSLPICGLPCEWLYVVAHYRLALDGGMK